MQRQYRRVKDRPDSRDIPYTRHLMGVSAPLPAAVDLRPYCSPVENQLNTNSCTGHAIVGSLEYLHRLTLAQGQTPLEFSRLFVYYNERFLEHDVNEDQGAMIRDGIKVIAQYGVCTEELWPFSLNRVLMKPTMEAYDAATKYRAMEYASVPQTEDALKTCLAISQRPIVFGINLYPTFESPEVAASGLVPMPKPGEPCIGGHAVLIVGYDDATRMFLVRNSWGPDWGQGGYFQIPYQYVLEPLLAEDFWVITSMTV